MAKFETGDKAPSFSLKESGMELKQYFEQSEGTGVLATADAQGKVDLAVYARPHFLEGDKIGFIMRPRLSYQNLQSNPYAAYLFLKKGDGYQGQRLYLEKIGEENDPAIMEAARHKPRRNYPEEAAEPSRLVYFRLVRTRPLVGD